MEAIEFYSGIGGLAAAAHENGIHVKLSFDILPLANKTHSSNFPDTVTSPTTICNLTPSSLIKLFKSKRVKGNTPHMWLLSPPCQPFSRRGQQKDREDPRNESFLHLIDLLQEMENNQLPQYILIENVAYFEKSETREYLITTLTNRNYTFQEFHLTPTQFGIPNQRLRYFCLAKLKPHKFLQECSVNEIQNTIPEYNHTEPSKCLRISEYLEMDDSEKMYNIYNVPDDILVKSGRIFDIITPNDNSSNCFTKSYGRYVEGSGSVIQTNDVLEKEIKDESNPELLLEELRKRKLRYFSPEEMLRIHGFPSNFQFPDGITTLQSYKLIGNSLNVTVVKELISYLLKEP